MNTSRYAESYRIQTYAEYIQGKQQQQEKDKLGQNAKSWGEDGWVKSHYTSSTTSSGFGYPRYACAIFAYKFLLPRIFCRFVLFSSTVYLWSFYCCCCSRGLRKRSISPVQGEQGSGEPLITDGWSHYSYLDSTGSKKMRTDGVWTHACKRTFLATRSFPVGKYLAEVGRGLRTRRAGGVLNNHHKRGRVISWRSDFIFYSQPPAPEQTGWAPSGLTALSSHTWTWYF